MSGDDNPAETPEPTEPSAQGSPAESPAGDPQPVGEPQPDGWDEAAADLFDNPETAEGVAAEPEGTLTVESLVVSLEQVTAERDELIQARMRQQADFENTKKQMLKRQGEQTERANEALVGQLLDVLDAMEAARQHASEAVEPLHTKLLEVLGKAGLTPIAASDEPFDPTMHEAVMHEDGPGGDDGTTVVAEVLRAGYAWKGRTLRPAMVKVRG